MPRIEFDTFQDAEKWVDQFVFGSDRKYVGYYTKNGELIFTPTKSTQPIIYSLIRYVKKEMITKLSEKVQIFSISNFEWNSDRGLSIGDS